MTTTRIYTHPVCHDHDPGPGHPESPARLRAIIDVLSADLTHAAPLASHQALARAHDRDFVDAVFAAAPQSDRVYLDPDTAMSPGSLDATRRGSVRKSIRMRSK